MRTSLRSLLSTYIVSLSLAASGALVAACSDDDPITPAPMSDAGTDATSPHDDAGPQGDGSVNHPETGTDGGAQDFSVFVKDLIQNHTNGTESPAALPADNLFTDKQDPNAYPASFFP